jgi:hypothetical protein
MKFGVFWDVEPSSHIEVDRSFGGAYCLHHQGDHRPDDGVRTSETSVNFNVTTRRYIPEGSKLQGMLKTKIRRHVNLSTLSERTYSIIQSHHIKPMFKTNWPFTAHMYHTLEH